MCVAPSVFSDLSLAWPGPTHKPAEPSEDGVSPMVSVEGVKEEAARNCVEVCLIQNKWQGI